jgi:hypothetical protein
VYCAMCMTRKSISYITFRIKVKLLNYIFYIFLTFARYSAHIWVTFAQNVKKLQIEPLYCPCAVQPVCYSMNAHNMAKVNFVREDIFTTVYCKWFKHFLLELYLKLRQRVGNFFNPAVIVRDSFLGTGMLSLFLYSLLVFL